jgi:predicted DNA binding CopG/RHH family protein
MSCPQDWAAAIHAEETGQTGQLIIRKVPESLRRELKAKAAAEGRSMQGVILKLIEKYTKGGDEVESD